MPCLCMINCCEFNAEIALKFIVLNAVLLARAVRQEVWLYDGVAVGTVRLRSDTNRRFQHVITEHIAQTQ